MEDMTEKFMDGLMDDIDACYWCPICELRREDCRCQFDDEMESEGLD